jgi:ParB-like chromosome segregation protein Spo0J
MPATARRIEMWPLTRLKPYERNARTHSREQVRQIVASIKEFGFTNPLLVDGADGILAGHGRLAAAKDMGLTEVPVIVLDHLSAEQRRAYVLADNQLALNAGWDAELLQMEVTALSLVDFDLNLLGFSPDELTAALGGEFGAVDELEEEPDQGANRDIALAIVLSPEELGTWRKAKAEIGYSTDKAALLKLVDDLLEEAGK